MHSTTRLEQLPVELLLIIFSYLEGYDLIKAFANLNSFFDRLLHSSQVQIHLCVNENMSEFPHIFIKNIRSLSDVSYHTHVSRFIDLHISQLKQLQSLTINVDDYDNTPIISILPKFVHLEYLNIQCEYSRHSSSTLSVIVSLPTLRVCIIKARRCGIKNILAIDPVPLNNSIVHLNVQTRLQTSCLHSILHRLSCLRSLQVTYLTRNTSSLLPQSIFENLRMITFTDTSIKVSDFDEILQKLPNLELISAGPIMVNENKFEKMLLDQRWMKSFDHIKRIDIEIKWSFFMEGKKEDMRTRLPQSHPGLRGPWHQYIDGCDNEHAFSFFIDFNRNMKKRNKWGLERDLF
ncbi:unnamed protein product [Adineta ricciae]|uniref:F-box domain-containing protein n=1 Tax=Adineta ricciae TaxID=249248 RepID=A0A816C7T5_ADIRI|nr:unnamed protein product [Adineta ricciae]CAF1619539.1 unnamed protein product [Adineta ricciae]